MNETFTGGGAVATEINIQWPCTFYCQIYFQIIDEYVNINVQNLFFHYQQNIIFSMPGFWLQNSVCSIKYFDHSDRYFISEGKKNRKIWSCSNFLKLRKHIANYSSILIIYVRVKWILKYTTYLKLYLEWTISTLWKNFVLIKWQLHLLYYHLP